MNRLVSSIDHQRIERAGEKSPIGRTRVGRYGRTRVGRYGHTGHVFIRRSIHAIGMYRPPAMQGEILRSAGWSAGRYVGQVRDRSRGVFVHVLVISHELRKCKVLKFVSKSYKVHPQVFLKQWKSKRKTKNKFIEVTLVHRLVKNNLSPATVPKSLMCDNFRL